MFRWKVKDSMYLDQSDMSVMLENEAREEWASNDKSWVPLKHGDTDTASTMLTAEAGKSTY